jgi:rod shape-determining protein MreD
MKKVLFFLFLFLAITLEMSFFSFWKIKGPDFVLVLIIFWIIIDDFERIWPAIILTGIILDFLSALPFGIISLSLITASYFIDWLKKNVFSQINYPLACLLIVFGVLFYDFFLAGLGWLFRLNLSFNLIYLPIELAFNLLTATILYGIFHYCSK